MLEWGLQMIIFSIVKRLSKITFSHLKHMHLELVSFAFLHYG